MLGIAMNATSFRGIGMVLLQVLRACTVITLATVAASCWILVIHVDKSRPFFVFECASYFFTSTLCLALIVTEFPLIKAVRGYLARSWPILSRDHGVGWLGVALVIIGCNLMGSLNRPAYDVKNLGSSFSQLVLAAAVLAITFGFLNIICALIWRDAAAGINSRDIRANGSLAESRRQSLPDYSSSADPRRPTSGTAATAEKVLDKVTSLFSPKTKNKSKFQSEKARPDISRPFPTTPEDIEQQLGVVDDDRRSPIAPGVRRPDTALHPMHSAHAHDSFYSEARMSRF